MPPVKEITMDWGFTTDTTLQLAEKPYLQISILLTVKKEHHLAPGWQ